MKRQLEMRGRRRGARFIQVLTGAIAMGGSGFMLAADAPVTPTPEPAAATLKLKPLSAPLPIGQKAREIKIPQYNLTGQVLSQILAGQVQRVDDEFLQIQELKLDLYDEGGKSEFRIDMPVSLFSTKTRVITSDQAVFIHHRDFDLTGARMEFNTATRKGRLLGPVTMKIRDVERVAAKDAPAPPTGVPPK